MNIVFPASPCLHRCLPVPISRATPRAATAASSSRSTFEKRMPRSSDPDSDSSTTDLSVPLSGPRSVTPKDLGASSPGKARRCRSRGRV